MRKTSDRLQRIQAAKRESRYLEFKAQVDPTALRDVCELIKDIVGMANSGGGLILIGVNDDGSPSDSSLSQIQDLDPSFWLDKVASYAEIQLSDLQQETVCRQGRDIVVILVPASPLPIIFTKPGTYSIGPKEQRTAFARGTVYFRHGAKSEPGNNHDIRQVMDRTLDRVRAMWSKGIRKVVEAPEDHVVHVVSAKAHGGGHVQSVAGRVVADPRAPGFHPANADDQWPHRQKDVIQKVKKQVPGAPITPFDILCIRRVDHLEDTRRDFVYRPFKKAPAQFSEAFVDWLVASLRRDTHFCIKYRERHRAMTPASGS